MTRRTSSPKASILNAMFIMLTLVFAYFLNEEKVEHQETKNTLTQKEQVINTLITDTSFSHKRIKQYLWSIKEKDKEISFLRLTNRSVLGKTLTDSIVRENIRLKLVVDSLEYELDQYEDNAYLDEKSQQILRFNKKLSTHPRNATLALQE